MAATSSYPTGQIAETRHGDGWVMFAGIMIIIAGVIEVIYGIAAIDKANFYGTDQRYVFSDLNTWGWIHTVLGVAMVFAGFGIFRRAPFAVWFGVAVASLNAIGQLLSIDAYPFLSLALFAIDVLIVYGLVVYGGRERA
jgi:hypothetical protein